MPTSPLTADTDLVSVAIAVDGKELSSAYTVMSANIERQVNRIARARIVLALTPMENESKTFKLSESNEFVPGNDIEIKAGYDLKTKTIFKGVITSQGLNISGNNQIELEVGCMDKAVRMTSGRRSKYFKEKTDSSILGEIISDYPLEKSIDSTQETYPLMVQYQTTDWDFLVSRAQVNGMLVSTQDGKVVVQKPTGSGSADLVLTFGKDVYEFRATVDMTHQIADVNSYGWSADQQNLQNGRSQEPSLAKTGNFKGNDLAKKLAAKAYELHTPAPLSKGDLKTWANAHLLKSRLAMLQGEISFIGNAQPQINKLIKLDGFGKRYNGDALITGLRHEIEEGQWITTVSLGLEEEWFFEKVNVNTPAAGGILPAIQGLHIGLVKKIHEDKEGNFRVLVNVPTISESEQEVWARPASPYATNQKGCFFYPEIGDEVVVGFLGNDPRFAVMLGSLYSKKKKPPFTPDEKNQFKGIVSNSELKITFDDVDKILTLSTPGKQQIIISDKDKNITIKDMNGNTVLMSNSGIDLKSGKDVNISAQGSISLKANQKIAVEASGGDVSLQGLNVKAQGKMSFEASGAASSKLSSSGQLTIQGAMVMIN